MLPDDGRRREEDGAELAGGERFQGAQAAFEFGRGYAAGAPFEAPLEARGKHSKQRGQRSGATKKAPTG